MVFMLAFLCGFIMLFRGIWSDVSRRTQRIAITSCCMGALMVWMSTLYFPWDYLCRLCRIFRYIIVKIQFPWRFTGVAIGIITLLWCVLISTIEEKEEKRDFWNILKRYTYTILRSYYPWIYIISNFLPLFSLRGTSLKKKVNHRWAHKIVPRRLKGGKILLIK